MGEKDGGDGECGIGYGRPPMHTRFKPGQSGNVRGRPRGSKNLTTTIVKSLNRKGDYQREWSPKENHNA